MINNDRGISKLSKNAHRHEDIGEGKGVDQKMNLPPAF
jgi:hypothetical protein